ncbi:putative sugar phosphate/phosphate translocator [Lachnellula occidentalis]|uniref:Putative sugar phosphate/phosphate translocator n=1 Tax=Lachnellula occidentalis TaxID=215460 RepID=A0A8H8RMM3_9HELO|nr:putative sugar phosphate/phosphate translocator [Lachnellula occidentalis]
MLPITEKEKPLKAGPHPAFYFGAWMFFSIITILFNKYLLSDQGFHYRTPPFSVSSITAILTCWHLFFATIMTQILARTTSLLDNRKKVKMTSQLYLRAIVPIGVLYSASLVCSNQTYLYLSVAFIQMLKASAPIAVLLTSWAFRVESPQLKTFINVLAIGFGVALASFGEIKFSWIGFLYQAGGVFSESIKVIMIQILLSGQGQKMDPLVSLYYYAPVCTVMNFLVAAATEAREFGVGDVWRVGPGVLLANAAVAFLLNVASVFLIGKTSGLVMILGGVFKNILLVVASVIFWGTIITPLQLFGYSIATIGLIYFGVGYNGIVTYCAAAKRMWGDGDELLPSPRFVRKVMLIILYTAVLALCVTGAAVKSGNVPAFLTERLPPY